MVKGFDFAKVFSSQEFMIGEKGTVKIPDRECWYLSILDSIYDSVFSVDTNYNIITANKHFRERTLALTGIDLVPGHTIFTKGKNQHIIDEWNDYLHKAMQGETFKVESEFVVGDKTYFREATFTPIRQHDEIKGVVCYSKDISTAKIFKEQLEEQEVLFRTLLENSHDGIAMISAGGRLKYISPSVVRILGYTFEEMIAIGMADLVHPDDLNPVLHFTENLVPHYGESDQIIYRMRSKKRGWKYIHCHYTNMLHEPSIKALVINYEDITERRELEVDLENTVHELINADERQSSIINSLRANIALLNQNGVIMEVNEAWKQFGCDNQLISNNFGLGANYLAITDKAASEGDGTSKSVANGIRAVLDNKLPEFTLEYTCHSKTEKRWFNLFVYPLSKKSKRGGVVVYHVDVTERKLADLQIEFHRSNQDALINSTTDLMWSFGADMHLITANNAFLSVVKMISNLDLKPGDNLLSSQAFSEEELAFWVGKYNRALSGERFSEVVNREQLPDYWTEISFNPIWENGVVIGAACYSRDISERMKTELLLLQNQQMMMDAESIAHFGSWELDLKDRKSSLENPLRWSDEVSRIFGYEPGTYEVSNENFFKAVHPDDREPIRQAIQKAISEQSFYSITHRIIRPTGEVRWVHEAAKIVINEKSGEPTKVVGTVLDITDRKAAKEKLKEAERNYREIFDKASDAIFVHDVETGRVIDVNSKACEIIGCTKEEILCADPADFMAGTPGSSIEDAVNFMTKAVTEGPQLFEFHSKRKDGTLYWNEVNLSLAKIAGTERILAFFRNIDDRKKAEENLRNSEARYRQIVETAQEGIWMLDENNRTIYVNNKMCEILEYSREEMMGKQNYDFMDEEMKQRAYLSIKRRKLGITENMDVQYITKTGRHIWASLSASPLQEEDGKYIGALAMVTDITDRKLAEESVRLSNERYELATKATNDAVWDWNLLTNEIYWSEGYENLFGYKSSKVEFTLESWTKRIHPDDVERVWTSIQKEINDPSSRFWHDEYRYIKSDGSIAFVNDRGYIIYNEDGIPIRMVGAMQDITARKLAEESLHKSEANLRTVFDHADRAYVLLDKGFNILSFNSAANEIARIVYKAEFQEGKSMISYMEAERREDGERILGNVLAGRVYDRETQYATPDGEIKWYRVRRYPVRNEKGEILGICIATKDSTQRKNFELERDKLTNEIVQRNKDLEQYAYIVSHNLRAPVANIIGFTDALMHMDLDEDEKLEMMNGLDISIKRLDNVIIDLNHILQVKKEIKETKKTVQFSTLIDDISLSIGTEIEKANITIATDFTQVDSMLTQKSYLYSIFYNLISNSIKYRNLSVASFIEVKSRKFDNKIELTFSDNGLGIDLKKQNGQVFGLYKRFHPQAAEGKGMGLFMVKTQVENLGGKITIDSEINVGTKFTIIFDS